MANSYTLDQSDVCFYGSIQSSYGWWMSPWAEILVAFPLLPQDRIHHALISGSDDCLHSFLSNKLIPASQQIISANCPKLHSRLKLQFLTHPPSLPWIHPSFFILASFSVPLCTVSVPFFLSHPLLHHSSFHPTILLHHSLLPCQSLHFPFKLTSILSIYLHIYLAIFLATWTVQFKHNFSW